MKDVLEFLSGKKTYLVATAIVVLGFLQGMDIWVVPEVAWAICGAIGLGTLRASVTKVSEAVDEWSE